MSDHTPLLRMTAGLPFPGGWAFPHGQLKVKRLGGRPSRLMPDRNWRAEQDSNPLPPAVPAGVLPKAPPARGAATDLAATSQSLGILLFFRKSYICLPFVNASVSPIEYHQLIFSRMGYCAVFWYQTHTSYNLHFFRGRDFPLSHDQRRFFRPPRNPTA